MVVGRLIKRMVPGFLKQKIKTYLKLYCGDNSPKYVKYDLNIQNVGRAKDKVILVTGGTGAIGSAVCLRMALEGAIVGLCGRTEMKIEKTIEQIKQCYPEAKLVPVVLDVTNEHNIEDAISKFAQQNGKLDILINLSIYFLFLFNLLYLKLSCFTYSIPKSPNTRFHLIRLSIFLSIKLFILFL